MKRTLPALILLLLLGLGVLPATSQSSMPRIPRFSYRLKQFRSHHHELTMKMALELPGKPYLLHDESLFVFDFPAPTGQEIIESYLRWRQTHDEMDRPYERPFAYGLFASRVASVRARQAHIAREIDQGLIRDIELEWLATTLRITGRKLFELGFVAKDYENPPDPSLRDGQRDFKMDQETQIRVEGTIAERVIVNVDYDDTRDNDARNEISLIYQGREDEFIHRAELGDVMLSVPGTRFVSYSTKSLFGAKVIGGLGEWFNFTLIGSREKGISAEEEYTGTGQLQRMTIRDTDYLERRFYRVDTNPNHFGNPSAPIQIADDPITGAAVFNVWIYAAGQSRDPGVDYYEFEADRYDDDADDNPMAPPQPRGETITSSYWRLLQPVNDYTINKYTGRLSFNTTLQQNEYVAITYSVALQSSPTQVIYRVGGDELPLPKLIKSGMTGDRGLMEYMHHNIYSLGAMGIELDSDFMLQIEDLQGRTNDALDINDNGDTEEPLVRALGLTRDPHGADDSINPQVIDRDQGLLMFPERYPFRKEGEEGTNDDAYDPSYGNRNHRFIIRTEYHSAMATRFLRPNIIPGSEVILLNGRRLVRDIDYIIDYDSGFLEFLIPGAGDSDADLKITYEYKPFFGDTGKTLAGGRLEFKPLDFFTLGGTYIGEWTDKPADRREIPELRDVPATHQVLDVDARLELNNTWMTDLINLVPGINTQTESSLIIEGETALSFYNPNRMGRAHLDSLESAHQIISMPLRDADWIPSSPPTYSGVLYSQAVRRLVTLDNVHNYPRNMIDPEWRSDETATLLEISDLPQQPGQWDSIARIIAANGLDLSERNIEYLEFYLFRNGPFNGGRLHFDIGMINEDADGDYIDDGSFTGYDSEDQGSEPGFDPTSDDPYQLDGRLQPWEDIGIEFDNGYIRRIIGADDGVLTTEDLDFSLRLNTEESYYSYAVDLDQIPPEYLGRDLGNGWVTVRIPLNFDETRPGDNSPPDNTVVKAMRIWVENTGEGSFAPSSSLYLYRVHFRGVRWRPGVIEPDSPLNTLDISTIDTETSGEYVPLEPVRDRDGFVRREQALELAYRALVYEDDGHERAHEEALRQSLDSGRRASLGRHDDPAVIPYDGASRDPAFPDVHPLDYHLWPGEAAPAHASSLSAALTSEPTSALGPAQPPGVRPLDNGEIVLLATQSFFDSRDLTTHDTLAVSYFNRNAERTEIDWLTFRFGTDNTNYYEFRVPLAHPDAGWQRVEVAFSDLIALRQRYDEMDRDTRPLVYREGDLAVRGSPSLVRVFWLAVGVTVTEPMIGHQTPELERGRLWINNIDLYNAVQREGQATRGRVALDFGKVLNIAGDYTKMEGDFQSIGLRRTGTTREDYQVSATLQLGAFFPRDSRVGLPLTVSYTHSDHYIENISEYEGPLGDLGRTTSETTRVGLSFNRVNLPRLNLAYSNYSGYNSSYGRNDDNLTFSANLDYSLLQPFFLLPTMISARYLYRTNQTRFDEHIGRVGSHTATHEFRASMTWQFIRGLTMTPSYSFTDTLDLRRGEDISFTQNGRINLTYNRYRLAQPSLDYSTTYTRRFNPGGYHHEDSYNVSVQKSFSASLNTSPGLLLEKVFGSWTANANFSLRRGSSYADVTETPPFDYIWGWETVWREGGEALSASRGYSYMLSTRFRPLEFFRASADTSVHDIDFLLAQIRYAYSNDIRESYGTTSQTWTETWPAGDLTVTTTKYFPIFADLLQQSILRFGYQKTTVKRIGFSLSKTYSPSVSWRAVWSDTFSTTVDYSETTTIVEEEDTLFGYEGARRVTNTYSPSASLTYTITLPGRISIPFLGGDVPLRNDLRLGFRYSYRAVEGNRESGADHTKRHTATVTAAYYLTTNVFANLSMTYEDYANETSLGYNYNSFDVRLTVELKF